jgi:phosphatidylglycerophosphate synthase
MSCGSLFLRLDLVPLWVPVLFLVRSFVVDGIRGVAFCQGKPGFSMMHTAYGRFLVASRFMRALYGVAKVATFAFLWLTHALALEDPRYLISLKTGVSGPHLADRGPLRPPGHPGAPGRTPLFRPGLAAGRRRRLAWPLVMGTLAAIFDIDHTLVRGGTERLFFRYLLRYRQLP